jgi:hypothetical protein
MPASGQPETFPVAYRRDGQPRCWVTTAGKMLHRSARVGHRQTEAEQYRPARVIEA